METDHQFYELFRAKPEWFESLSGIKLPSGCVGTSITHKKIETRSDLVFEPANKRDPRLIVEFQFYLDHSVFERLGMGRHSLWRELNSPSECRQKNHKIREVRGVVIFGRKSHIPPSEKTRHPLIEYQVLGDLLESLQKREPESILLDVLAPIVEPTKILEKSAGQHYRDIAGSKKLSRDDRELAEEIYFSFLLQRLKNKSPQQLREMIAELAPLRETRFVKECIKESHDEGVKEGIEKGIEKGTREIALRMYESGLSVDRISEITKLTKKVVRDYLK